MVDVLLCSVVPFELVNETLRMAIQLEDICMLFAGREFRTEKNCDRGLAYVRLRVLALVFLKG